MGEAIRDDLVGGSDIYARFDAEKQIYFKWMYEATFAVFKAYLKIKKTLES